MDESVARLNAVANGANIAPDDHRMYDVNAAHAAAIQENNAFDSRIQDVEAAHAMALEEDKARTDAAAAEAAAKEIAEQKKTAEAKADEEAAVAKAAVQGDIRKQAEVALQQSGTGQSLAPESKVSQNPLTRELTVTTGNHTQVLRPQFDGSYKATDYAVNPLAGTVTIKSGGSSIIAGPAGKYEAAEGEGPELNYITLPSDVAHAVGFSQAVKVGAAPLAPQEV
jgi:hypothetical protein